MKTISLSFLMILLLACGSPQSDPESVAVSPNGSPAVSVRTETVQDVAVADMIVASGKLASQEEVRLSFKIGGIIRSLYSDAGSSVRKGQILARLDATEINAQVLQAEEALRKAERDLKRVEALYADSVATLEQVQDLGTARSVAAANLEIARFNQKHAVIQAPASGRILRRFAEQGELIGAGSPVFLLASTQEQQIVKVGLVDRDVVRLQENDPATVVFDAWPETDFPARVGEIAAGADPVSGTFTVELLLTETPKALKNGFIAKVNIQPSSREHMKQIPLGALVEAGPEYASFYVPHQDSTARLHVVRHYQIYDDHLRVPAAEWGEVGEVITRGAKYLRPDQAISVAGSVPVQPVNALSTQQAR